MATKTCPTCSGSTNCNACRGTGNRYKGMFSSEKCKKCNGTGNCTRCRGNGVVPAK